MTTIIRVKRHRKEDPVEAFLLSCKRKKTEDESKDFQFEKILNFTGTVEEKDDKIAASTVRNAKETKYSDLANKRHVPDITVKQRTEVKARSDDNRFKLLSCLRSSNGFEGDGEDVLGSDVTIVDVSKENDEKSTASSTCESSYVYDLYSANFRNDSDFNDLYMENLLSIQPLESELEYRNGEDCYEEEVDPDEDDSNDENNWRNDYPDTESDADEDEEGDNLAKQLKGFHIDDDYELSDDSEEEKYSNYIDEDKYFYYDAEDIAGKRYTRYKANALKQMMDNGGDEEESEDDSNYYEDASYNYNSD